jgi:hypothetical protein
VLETLNTPKFCLLPQEEVKGRKGKGKIQVFFFEPRSFAPHSHAIARKYGERRVLNPGWSSARLFEPVLLTKRALSNSENKTSLAWFERVFVREI